MKRTSNSTRTESRRLRRKIKTFQRKQLIEAKIENDRLEKQRNKKRIQRTTKAKQKMLEK